MTPLKTLQTAPTRINDLFAQLADTTPGALKTRERLFGELRTEIELAARLEHEHLMPVLQKHEGTKRIVAQTEGRLEALAERLKQMADQPMDGEGFPGALRDLKAAFQEHLRDEKNTLLPKVQKALSDEELEAVASAIESDRVETAATAEREAEAARDAARAKRQKEAAKQAAMEAVEAEARRVAKAARDAVKAAERAAEETVQQAADIITAPVEISRATAKVVQQSADVTTQGIVDVASHLGAAAQSGLAYAEATRDVFAEWRSWAAQRSAKRMAVITDLMACRTPVDLFSLQARMVREEVELLVESGSRISRIASSTVEQRA